MEASSSVQYQMRSISLPARLTPDPFNIEPRLNKLKTSLILSKTTTASLENIQTYLVGLVELYNSVEELIQSPLTQKALLQHGHGALVEELLEGSVGLLDSCAVIGDLLGTMKERVQNIHSALRRKGGDSSIGSDISAYICFRKKVKKDIAKSLKALKLMVERIRTRPLFNSNCHLAVVYRVLREVASVTIFVFRSLLSLVSSPSSLSKASPSGWSLISKLVITKSTRFENDLLNINDVGRVDLAISSLQRQLSQKDAKIDVQTVIQKLQLLEETILGLENGVSCLFRRLVQSRVSLLNIHV